LAGIGGHGNNLLGGILKDGASKGMELVAGADPFPDGCKHLAELKQRGVEIYADFEECLKRHRPELAIISSPIHLHCPQTVLALNYGCHVLCEKPAAATVQEVRQMIAARDAAKKQVAIGYDGCWAPVVQAMKKDILSGLFGRPRRLRALIFAPRDEVYYNRNKWAGRQRDLKGNWVLDSPANNSNAHTINLMLYLLGRSIDRSADLSTIQAELYRANPIENFDTGVMRIATVDGVQLHFSVSHAMLKDTRQRIRFAFEFELGTLSLDWNSHEKFGNAAVGTWRDGATKAYEGSFYSEHEKVWASVRGARTNEPPLCSLEAAGVQTQVINGAQLSMPDIVPFPADQIITVGEPGNRQITVRNLEALMTACYDRMRLPSEAGAPWGRPGKIIQLKTLTTFP
jgi:predicted dehydrogenase